MKKNEYTTETPVFSERLDILDPTDPGHADILNPINKQIFENTLYLKGKINEYIGNTDNPNNPDSGMGFVEGIKADNVVGAINEVFQSGNKKKQKLVSNLVAMGIEADTSDTWEQLLDKMPMVFGSIYDAFVAAGVTPTAQTPEALVVAISTLKQQSYNSGKADGAASPADRAISVRGEIVNDGRGTYQGLRINFPNKGTYCQVHNQEYATWYLSQMI